MAIFPLPIRAAVLARRVTVLLLALIVLPAYAAANEYSPPGIYEVKRLHLDNGLQVLLKQRGEARTASLRLAVGVGFQDVSCAEAQLPHLLEHIVFEGTEAYPEPGDLDGFVEGRGGYSNAFTYLDQTVYHIDIYGPEAPAAVEALYQMGHKALFDDEAIEGAKPVVHRELGSDASALRRWLYARGIGQSGTDKADEVLGFECPGMDRVDGMSRERLLDLYREYYVAGNMTLVVVGRFDEKAVLERIRETFGIMPAAPAPARPPRSAPNINGPLTVESTLHPVLGSEAEVVAVFPTAGYLSEDYPALSIISDHLEGELYNRLRRKARLSYGPGAGLVAYADHGYFYVGADAAPGRLDEAVGLIRQELDLLMRDGIDAEWLEEVKRSLLLSYAGFLETNADTADYYADSLAELEVHGRFVNYEKHIEAVTPEQIRDVARRVFRLENSVVALNAPAFGYSTGLLFGGALLLVGVVVTGRGTLRGQLRRNSFPPR